MRKILLVIASGLILLGCATKKEIQSHTEIFDFAYQDEIMFKGTGVRRVTDLVLRKDNSFSRDDRYPWPVDCGLRVNDRGTWEIFEGKLILTHQKEKYSKREQRVDVYEIVGECLYRRYGKYLYDVEHLWRSYTEE